MKLTYQLDQNDFLQHQLYMASTSDRVKKQRTRSWLIVSGSMLLLSLLFNQSNNSHLFYYFLAFGILTLLFYPLYQRRYYRNHYAKFIADTYKDRFGLTANIIFTELAIESDDISGQSRFNLSELEKVTETPGYFYPKLKASGHLIIPKSKVDNVPELRMELKQLCERLGVPFIEDLNWKWK